MISKTFVSLYFFSDRLLLLQLDASKKKVKKYSSVDLPEGVLRKNKVYDKELLATTLRSVWSKLKIKEKSVGLVIPELSTFTKLLTIPKINLSEMDEAVRWQAQEFLPTNLTEMTMDWKIVSRKDREYEVLVVALEKKILSDYVESAELAGLYPIAVEIPSLCLVRAADEKDEVGKLIFYKNFGEIVIILTQGGKIFGSSVLETKDSASYLNTVKRMASHYKDVKVEKIYLGGAEISENLANELGKITGGEVKLIKSRISGINEKQMQEFIIPLNMQFNQWTEPSDPFSLNLLPPNLVDKYKSAKLRLQIWSLTLTITLFVWISFLVTLGAYLFMNQQISEAKIKNGSTSSFADQRQKAISDVKYINGVTDKVTKIKKSTFYPQNMLQLVNSAKPPGVTIIKYKLDLDRGQIDVEGSAINRQELITFKDNLEANSDISSIQIPVTSFETETNLQFRLGFEYKPIKATVPAVKR